jgi:hypothetical protein
VNDGRDGGEHILISIDVPGSTLDRIRNVIGMGQVLEEETENHEELEREHRTDKRRLESSVSDLLENASIYTVHDYEGERSTLGGVVEEQVQAVFGATRKVLSRPLVEVEDAKDLAQFFRGSGTWPLADADAVLLGVDTATASLADTGWCREFIDEYESKKAVDVETLLQQTRTANGDYRGTPQESIAALLITLATSNEQVALKHDTEYVTDPSAIGRQVRTKGGLTSLQVRFGVETANPKEIRNVVSTILGADPAGSDPDAWVDELGSWIADNSVLVKRTFKGTARAFDVSLDALERVLSPAYSGGEITTSELVEDDVQSAAETFADARELFAAVDGEKPLWDQFTTELERLEEWYPNATITSRMQSTAESGSVPTKTTVTSRLADATGHRVDELSTQYRRVTGESPPKSDPDEICTELTEWLRENGSTVDGLIDDATETFDGVSFGALKSVFELAWHGDRIDEGELVDSAVRRQAEEYGTVRELLEGDPSPWSKLRSAHEKLHAAHRESPTTESVSTVLDASRPPSIQRVRQLIKEAADPKQPGADDDAWAELQRVAEELRQELPNAAVTDDVTGLVDTGDRPTDERATELLDEAETLLARIREVRAALDDVEDGGIVLIEEMSAEGGTIGKH